MAVSTNNHAYQVPPSTTFQTMEDDSLDQLDDWHRSAMAGIEMAEANGMSPDRRSSGFSQQAREPSDGLFEQAGP